MPTKLEIHGRKEKLSVQCLGVDVDKDAVIYCQECPKNDKGEYPKILVSAYPEHRRKLHQANAEPVDNGVQLYSEHAKALLHSQQHKIHKLLEGKCIEYVGGNHYICKPLVNYNKTTYDLYQENGEWTCTCQYFRIKKETCAHIGALYEYFARGK